MGRPSRFNLSLAKRIFALVKEGKTDAEICKVIGVSLHAFKNWKSARPDFGASLKDLKWAADELVEASLFNRATGYKHRAVKFFFDSKNGTIHSKRYIENYAPDTTAAIFWLKNRQPENWREKHEVAFPDKNGNPQSLSVPEEEIDRKIKELEQKLKLVENE